MKKGIQKKMLAFIGMWMAVLEVMAVGRPFGQGYDEFWPYGYQPMGRWELVRDTYCGDRGFRDSLLLSLNERKRSYLICPWWLEDLYTDPVVAGCCRNGFGYVGYVLDPVSGKPALTNEWRNRMEQCLLNDSAYRDVPVDLVVLCRDGQAFDQFLCSQQARLNFLHQVFDWPNGAINQLHGDKRPRGIHFYLPEVTFREKRAFMQFVKSVSMVIDSLQVEDGVRPYTGDRCMLYITFATEARRELNFLSGVAVFVDEIYFADYNEYGVVETPYYVLNTKNDPTQLMVKLFNQFYLFHPWHRAQSGENGNREIDYLAQADYDNFQWVTYFYLEIALLLSCLLLIVLYNFYSPFYMLVDRNRYWVAPVLITLVSEVVILFLYILEALSKDDILFSMTDSRHLWLLAFPIVLVGLYILFRLLNQRRVVP